MEQSYGSVVAGVSPNFGEIKICMLPTCSMYGIFTYIWVIFRENEGKYTIHGAYGLLDVYGVLKGNLKPDLDSSFKRHYFFSGQ